MVPQRSYILWFSQRVGSTMLAQALEDTGIAGRPREWLNVADVTELLAQHDATTAAELRAALWREATTDNGVMAGKYGLLPDRHAAITGLFAELVEGSADPTGRLAWAAVFPACEHVFVTRRNKVRLAVSWWRAIKTQEWHLRRGENPSEAALDELYDYAAIDHLFVEASMREAAMQELFASWGIVPYTVVYEDFVASYEATVRGVLEYLAIPGAAAATIAEPAFVKLADDSSEAWVQRFRRERQADWNAPRW